MSSNNQNDAKTYRNTISVRFGRDAKRNSELMFGLLANSQLDQLTSGILPPAESVGRFQIVSSFVDDGEFTDEVDGVVRYENHFITTSGKPCSVLASGISQDRCTTVSHTYSETQSEHCFDPVETVDVYTGGVLTSRTLRVNWAEVLDAMMTRPDLEWSETILEKFGMGSYRKKLTMD